MNLSKAKKNIVLGVLFFLPVTFLLFLYPAKHNYTPLDIINESVYKGFKYENSKDANVQFNDRITVLGFIGKDPMSQLISISNLKELVYDKFKGFNLDVGEKKFRFNVKNIDEVKQKQSNLQNFMTKFVDKNSALVSRIESNSNLDMRAFIFSFL